MGNRLLAIAQRQNPRYHQIMSTVKLRRKIKKAIDQLPPKRLESLADYVEFLNKHP